MHTLDIQKRSNYAHSKPLVKQKILHDIIFFIVSSMSLYKENVYQNPSNILFIERHVLKMHGLIKLKTAMT